MKMSTLEMGRTTFEFHFYQMVLLLSKLFNFLGLQLSHQLIIIVIIIPSDMAVINTVVICHRDVIEIT